MGGSYYVPRSVKGETRLLYIFTVKSFATTIAFALVGVLLYFILSGFVNFGIIGTVIFVGLFGAIGYGLATITIPDAPIMGTLRKAGGENIGAMILRVLTFRKKKKMYIYNYKRNANDGGNK